jgi:hypothetical protein
VEINYTACYKVLTFMQQQRAGGRTARDVLLLCAGDQEARQADGPGAPGRGDAGGGRAALHVGARPAGRAHPTRAFVTQSLTSSRNGISCRPRQPRAWAWAWLPPRLLVRWKGGCHSHQSAGPWRQQPPQQQQVTAAVKAASCRCRCRLWPWACACWPPKPKPSRSCSCRRCRDRWWQRLPLHLHLHLPPPLLWHL